MKYRDVATFNNIYLKLITILRRSLERLDLIKLSCNLASRLNKKLFF